MYSIYISVPTGQPTNLRVLQFNGTALEAEWDPVEDTIELMKGRLLGYRVCLNEVTFMQ